MSDWAEWTPKIPVHFEHGRTSPSPPLGNTPWEKHQQTFPKEIPTMTPRELIEMLEKWKVDEPFELVVQNISGSNPGPYIGLAQGLNSINLSGKN